MALTKLFDLTSNTSGVEQHEPVVLVFLLASVLERELSTLPSTGLPSPPSNVTADFSRVSAFHVQKKDYFQHVYVSLCYRILLKCWIMLSVATRSQ